MQEFLRFLSSTTSIISKLAKNAIGFALNPAIIFAFRKHAKKGAEVMQSMHILQERLLTAAFALPQQLISCTNGVARGTAETAARLILIF